MGSFGNGGFDISGLDFADSTKPVWELSAKKTVIRGNTLEGKLSSIKATDALVERNQLTGESSSISTRDSDSGTQP